METTAPGAQRPFSLRERREAARKFREQLGLTLRQMAERAGISLSHLAHFETGRYDLSPEAMERLEKAIAEILSAGEVAKRQAALNETAEKFGLLSELLHAPGASTFRADSARRTARVVRNLEEQVANLREIVRLKDAQIADLRAEKVELERLMKLESEKVALQAEIREKRHAYRRGRKR